MSIGLKRLDLRISYKIEIKTGIFIKNFKIDFDSSFLHSKSNGYHHLMH